MSVESLPAIVLNKLSKRYGKVAEYALHEVSLHVMPGEVYGFLGANGAGKTTTIRTLLNFIQPSAGTAKIMGLDVVRDSVTVKTHIGYLSGDVALYPRMTGEALLRYLQELQPLKHREYMDDLTKRFEAELTKPVSDLSKGNRQKLGIIQALMHEPEVLILDEPTSGLDPLMQEVFYQAILDCKHRGCAVFVSSHNLTEVQRLCDTVGIIKNGKLITERTVADLQEAGVQRFTIHFATAVPDGLDKIASIESRGKQLATVVVKDLPAFLKFLSNHEVRRLQSEQADFEQEFLQLYGDDS